MNQTSMTPCTLAMLLNKVATRTFMTSLNELGAGRAACSRRDFREQTARALPCSTAREASALHKFPLALCNLRQRDDSPSDR